MFGLKLLDFVSLSWYLLVVRLFLDMVMCLSWYMVAFSGNVTCGLVFYCLFVGFGIWDFVV